MEPNDYPTPGKHWNEQPELGDSSGVQRRPSAVRTTTERRSPALRLSDSAHVPLPTETIEIEGTAGITWAATTGLSNLADVSPVDYLQYDLGHLTVLKCEVAQSQALGLRGDLIIYLQLRNNQCVPLSRRLYFSAHENHFFSDTHIYFHSRGADRTWDVVDWIPPLGEVACSVRLPVQDRVSNILALPKVVTADLVMEMTPEDIQEHPGVEEQKKELRIQLRTEPYVRHLLQILSNNPVDIALWGPCQSGRASLVNSLFSLCEGAFNNSQDVLKVAKTRPYPHTTQYIEHERRVPVNFRTCWGWAENDRDDWWSSDRMGDFLSGVWESTGLCDNLGVGGHGKPVDSCLILIPADMKLDEYPNFPEALRRMIDKLLALGIPFFSVLTKADTEECLEPDLTGLTSQLGFPPSFTFPVTNYVRTVTRRFDVDRSLAHVLLTVAHHFLPPERSAELMFGRTRTVVT